jgi:Zn-dependent protease
MNPEILQTLEIIFVLGTAVILHECAHGWVALKFGDPTAKLLGRLTLNPFKHIDPIGTVLVPIITKLTLGFPFGWAKPVPVNFANLNNPKRDMIFVALAGPAVNIVLALVASVFLSFAPKIFGLAVVINLMLATFNMMPIPPLDGSRVVAGLLPTSLARKYLYLEPFGFIIVIVLLQSGALDFLGGFVMVMAKILIGNLSGL